MKMSQAFPSKYLREADLNGQTHTVTIARVQMEDVGGQSGASEHKPVVYFRETDKGVVLNKTNGLSIASLYGDETDSWTDKQVQLYPDRVLFGNEMKPCIRIRGVAPNASGGTGLGGGPRLGATDERHPPEAFDPDPDIPF